MSIENLRSAAISPSPKSRYTLANLRQKMRQGAELIGQALQEYLFSQDPAELEKPQVEIRTATDRWGNPIWIAYNPYTQTREVLGSEDEARVWCERYFLKQ